MKFCHSFLDSLAKLVALICMVYLLTLFEPISSANFKDNSVQDNVSTANSYDKRGLDSNFDDFLNMKDWKSTKKLREEVISEEKSTIEFGDIHRILYKLRDGTTIEVRTGIIGLKAFGYSFNYTEHAYNDYSMNTLRILAQNNDRDAQMLLADILSQKKSTYDESNIWFIEAAKNGYYAALDRVALNYFRLGDNTRSEAFRILAGNATSGMNDSVRKFYRQYLTHQEIHQAKIIAINLRESILLN